VFQPGCVSTSALAAMIMDVGKDSSENHPDLCLHEKSSRVHTNRLQNER
jgi:hypothetical protein